MLLLERRRYIVYDDIQDAIQELQKIQSIYFHEQSDCLEEAHLLDVAIESLNKQLPKKTLLMQFAEPEYMCPTCGIKYYRKYEVNHCDDCGQKLDWD